MNRARALALTRNVQLLRQREGNLHLPPPHNHVRLWDAAGRYAGAAGVRSGAASQRADPRPESQNAKQRLLTAAGGSR